MEALENRLDICPLSGSLHPGFGVQPLVCAAPQGRPPCGGQAGRLALREGVAPRKSPVVGNLLGQAQIPPLQQAGIFL